MKTLRFLTVFLLIGIWSCGQSAGKHKVDPAAVQLNNQAMLLVAFIYNPDSSRKAISLLDKATAIDSNYFLGHYNKLMFFNQLKQFGKAVFTVNKLIQLQPTAHDLYLTGGVLYEQLGDTISSKSYFEKSLSICNSVLDTMNTKNRDYEMLVGNKAINLIMLGDQAKANELLKKLYESQTSEEEKKWTASLMNKNKKQILELWTSDQYSH
jgi:tetratricopeptide (TPR) repeat protein